MIFFGKILLKTLYFFITNISELDFEEKKSAEIVLHPMHGGGGSGSPPYHKNVVPRKMLKGRGEEPILPLWGVENDTGKAQLP